MLHGMVKKEIKKLYKQKAEQLVKLQEDFDFDVIIEKKNYTRILTVAAVPRKISIKDHRFAGIVPFSPPRCLWKKVWSCCQASTWALA